MVLINSFDYNISESDTKEIELKVLGINPSFSVFFEFDWFLKSAESLYDSHLYSVHKVSISLKLYELSFFCAE